MNLGEWPSKRAQLYPDRIFLKQVHTETTNRQFNDRVNRMAHTLLNFGVSKGQRVATLMVNCSEFLEIFFACAKTGAIMVPLNFKLTAPELCSIIDDCTPDILVYSSEFFEKVRRIKADSRVIRRYLQHGGEGFSDETTIAAIAASLEAEEPNMTEAVQLKDPLIIVYTSGTTGIPKGAVLSHENFLFGAIHSLLGYGINAGCRSLVIAPLFHVGALAASVTPVIYAGGSLILKDFENPSEVVQLVFDEKVNYMFAVPVMFEMMTKASTWEAADFNHVHFFISGGAPMPLSLIRKYQEEKGVQFAQGYAMTETLRLTSLGLEDSIRKAGSVGKEVFHTRLRLVDDIGRDVPAGEVGEIIVSGPTVFLGYWNRPEETDAAIRDGWFYTGDLARRDWEGFLYIVGRKKDMIIRSGENVYAIEVEQAIASLPPVAEAAVVGLPDPKRGEVVAAFVSLKDGADFDENQLIAGLKDRIAPFKIPKKVIFVETFPRNAAGKILKSVLKAALGTGTIPDKNKT